MHAGEREPISLSKEKVKWVLPPGVHASEEAASDSEMEDEGEGGHKHPRRGRGRKHDTSPGPDDCSYRPSCGEVSCSGPCLNGTVIFHHLSEISCDRGDAAGMTLLLQGGRFCVCCGTNRTTHCVPCCALSWQQFDSFLAISCICVGWPASGASPDLLSAPTLAARHGA